MSRSRGADALAASLVSEGVKRVFTLSGNHIMALFDAALDAGIELVHVRHEAAAVHMADAWARLTGEVGVALVTGGPGHANAVAALYTANMAESPVVLLSGHAPLAELGMAAFQEMRQVEMAAPACKASGMSGKSDDVGSDFVKAVIVAKSGRPGPVHLSLPTDVLEGEWRSGARRHSRDGGNADLASPAYLAIDASSLLTRLKYTRPLVICGPMCATRRGRERMAALEAASGIPVIAMESPRGMADPSLGQFAALVAKADSILLVGKRLDFTLKFGKTLAADCDVFQIDTDRSEIERTVRAIGGKLKGTAQGETFAALDALAKASEKSASKAWLAEVHAAIAHRPPEWDRAASSRAACLHPVQALRPLQALLDANPEAVFVSDGGEFGQWAQACLHAPDRVINGVAGAIGAALPFALAARLARPGAPVIAAMGDGTFGFHPAEIDTAVRYRLPFVAVVGNDARWNAEYQIQLRDYGPGRLIGCELLPTRYDQVAIAFGGHGEHVTDAAQLLPAARRAIDSGRPAVLNVMIDGVAAPKM